MNMQTLRKHLPVFFVGVLGAAVFQGILLGIGFGVVFHSPLRDALRDRFESVVSRAVTEQNLTDSAGNHSDVIDVVSAADPAVVSIVITKDVPKLEQIVQQDGQNSPFGIFGWGQPQYRQNGTEEKEIGGGSGFLVSDDGYIVTNAHVVSDADAKYSVLLNDESTHNATVIAADAVLDIAVLKIDASNLAYLEFGDSDTIRVGQSVVAIGNALGQFRNTVSVGVISGVSRSITAGSSTGSELLSDVLQTDAAINPGNSGGPLLDLSGHVIGVNVATSGGGENISFSLQSNTVKATVDAIRQTGHVVQPYLGVRYIMLTKDYAVANALSVTNGALVIRGENGKTLAVVPGSPADKAGIEENDIIVEVDGVVLDDTHPLATVLRQKTVGNAVSLKILHDGAEKMVTATLEERPAID